MVANYQFCSLIEQQFEATSADGTKIPYFVLTHRDTVKNGRNPCLLYGYGGFEISLTPSYSSVVGAGWLDADFDRHGECMKPLETT